MKLIQALIKQGNSHMITWLPADRRLKIGVEVDLDKDVNDRWKVSELYMTTDSENIQRGWGLNLPKSVRTEL